MGSPEAKGCGPTSFLCRRPDKMTGNLRHIARILGAMIPLGMPEGRMTPAELKAFRVEHGLCQGTLASRLGIARSTLVGYERGNSPIPKMLALAVTALHSEVPAYCPSPEILRQIGAKRFKRISDRVTSPSEVIGAVTAP